MYFFLQNAILLQVIQTQILMPILMKRAQRVMMMIKKVMSKLDLMKMMMKRAVEKKMKMMKKMMKMM